MLYAATAFWLIVIVLSAWGVHLIWGQMAKPRIVNVVLLPGTLVAQMGHVLGLLVTGATVTNTTLIKDDETGDPEQTAEPRPRIPFIGPVIIGMLPLIMCASAIYGVGRLLGGATVGELTGTQVSRSLPYSIVAFWETMRDLINQMETVSLAIRSLDLGDWHAIAFVYLTVCLSVRMAPFPGTLRGSLAAILTLAILAAVIASFANFPRTIIETGWSTISLAVAMLMLLLLVSLLIRGLVALVRMLIDNA